MPESSIPLLVEEHFFLAPTDSAEGQGNKALGRLVLGDALREAGTDGIVGGGGGG